jgi:beta-phosphoglucomutase
MKKYQAAIFDLDGVIVDTAKYHFLAWRRIAKELGLGLTQSDNEKLKGVSRSQSLDIILATGGITLSDAKKQVLLQQKNSWYVQYLQNMKQDELLPGAISLLQALQKRKIKTALGSASKNARLVLEKLNIVPYFDEIVDGNSVTYSKPNPEVFLRAAQQVGADAMDCVVFEDSQAGISAAKKAGMYAVGIGSTLNLTGTDLLIAGLDQFDINKLFETH